MSRCFDLRRDVGEHELDPLEARDRLPKLLTFLDVIQRIRKSALGDAEGLRADAGARAIQHRERDLETRALFAQTIRGRHLHFLENDLRGGRAADAELVLELFDLPRAGLSLQHKCGDAAVIGRGIRLRKYDEGAGDAAMRDELLGAVEHVIVAVLDGASPHRSRIRSAARFRQRIGGDPFARSERRAQSLLLLLGSRDENRIGTQCLHSEDQR